MSDEIELFRAAFTEVHQRLNAAGVPSAQGAICDDPACKSNLGHRVKSLVAERDQLLSLLASFRAAHAALRAAEDEAARLGEQADVGAVNEARRLFNEALGRLVNG